MDPELGPRTPGIFGVTLGSPSPGSARAAGPQPLGKRHRRNTHGRIGARILGSVQTDLHRQSVPEGARHSCWDAHFLNRNRLKGCPTVTVLPAMMQTMRKLTE
jgi:hypothetical protein